MASCLVGDLGGDGFPLGFVYQVFDLDEFVVVEDLVDVGECGLADAVSADLDSGFEAVGLFLEVPYLSRCELVHGRCRVLRFLNWFLFWGLVWRAVAVLFYFLWGWLFGVVLWVFLLFGGFFWFVLVLFWYCFATEWLLFCLGGLVGGVFRVLRVFGGVFICGWLVSSLFYGVVECYCVDYLIHLSFRSEPVDEFGS